MAHRKSLSICICSKCGYSSKDRPRIDVPLMQSFLYTDRRPSGDDFQKARHVRENLVEYLARLDAEKKSMEEALAVYERVLAPVLRLPPEILMEIFAWTRNSQSYHAHRVKGSPWVVSHVCKTWRAASLFCPELWNNFTVSHRSVHKKDPCSMLRAIVKRCQNVLHFVFRSIAKRTTSEKDEKLKALFQILLIHSEHWTVVDLSLISDLIPMLSQIRGRLPNLCRLYFSSSYPDVDVIDGFEISPRLTDLTIDWQFNQKTQIVFSAAKLINFTDRRVPDPRHPHPSSLNIVRTAPDLQTFHNTDALPSRITPRIRHEHLTTINTCDPCLLSSLSLPALTDVTLSHPPAGFPPQSDGLQALHDLVSHSHCSLLSLRLLETPLNRHLSGILERSPKLTSLSLEFFQWRRTDDVCLKSIIAHESLMPHLKTLIFLHRFIRVVPDLDETAAKFVDAVFVDAVALRWKSSFLKTVQVDVDFPVSLSSADVARLKGLKEEGLGISLCAKSYDGSKIIV